jgi:predicted transport protein
MPNGFGESPLFLNSFIARVETWAEEQIVERAKELGVVALTTWPLPSASPAAIRAARESTQEEGEESPTIAPTFFEDMPPELVKLYNILEEALLGFGPDVERLVYATRITFKAYKIFAQVNKRRGRLILFIDVSMDEIDDPRGICQDATDIGHHAVLNTQINIAGSEDLNSAIEWARRSYDRNSVETEAPDGN